MSPILGPVHLVLPRKKTLLNCVTYTWPHLLLKKICLLCHLYLATFICFSACCNTLDTPHTVSPLPAPVHLVMLRKKMTFNCVTFSWPPCYQKKISTVSAILGPVRTKNRGNIKKMTSPGSNILYYVVVVVEFNSKILYSSSSLSAYAISLKSSII